MKIASVECLPVHSGWRKNFVFVRIETDAGVVGWGEAYSQYDRDRAMNAERWKRIQELFHHVVPLSPEELESLCDTSSE
jgi:galactonate dehydratase